MKTLILIPVFILLQVEMGPLMEKGVFGGIGLITRVWIILARISLN